MPTIVRFKKTFIAYQVGIVLLLFFFIHSPIEATQSVSTLAVKQHPARANTPVLFVHGFNSNAAIPDGCNGMHMWGTAKHYLTHHHYLGQLTTIGYYNGDTRCDVNLKNQQNTHCTQYYPGHIGTSSEDLRHIACNLAWYIWEHFTQHGQSVQLVAHSMGGIIIRWAIFAAGNSSWPPYLSVRNAITIATPHNGIPWGGSITCGFCLQLTELQPGSTFLHTLQQEAQPSQGSSRTVWTIMGSSCESWLNGGIDPASEMAMAAPHKILYLDPLCYYHGDYLRDTSEERDAYANYCTDTCVGAPEVTTGYSITFVHALHEMWLTLIS